jgi:hypothetical protein
VQFVFDNHCLIAIGVNCTGAAVEPRSSTQLSYDVFAIQDEITEAIAAAIEPQIYAVETLTAEKSAQQPRRLEPSHASGTDVLGRGCYCIHVDEPLVDAAEHFCDLSRGPA